MPIEESLALGLEGLMGIVVDSKAYSQRSLGWCLEKQMGLVTLVPRTCGVRQELESWAQQQAELPMWVEKPGRTPREAARQWRAQSVTRSVPVAYREGRVVTEPVRFLVIHSSQLAQQHAAAYATAQAKAAKRVAAYCHKVQAQRFACQADAQAAIAHEQAQGEGQRGRPPQPRRDQTLTDRVETFPQRLKRSRRGRPAKDEPVEEQTRYRLVVEAQAVTRCEASYGSMVLATTLAASAYPDAAILQAYQDQASTVEHGLRWIKNAAAITPMWLEKPERLAALAMVRVWSLLVYG